MATGTFNGNTYKVDSKGLPTGKPISLAPAPTVSAPKTSSVAPAYNAKTGATTGKPSAEYDAYLTSLNKKGSANYIPTPDDTPINTAQPTPQGVQVGANLPGGTSPDTVNFDAKNGAPLAPGASTVDALGNVAVQGQKYKQGFAQTKASGIPTPTTAGGAAGTIASTVPKDGVQAPSPIATILDTDKNFDNILTSFDDYFSPVKQKQSLLQEYKGMEKSLGINSMNEELLNSKRIIDGTEDDIRSEVQAVSGFATDSQVLALANARNKSLVKNYNYLLEARDSAMTQLNTMMNLSIQDRKMAEDEFDRKLNFAFKVKDFQEKAKSNAVEGFNNVIKAVGYDGLFKSLQADPSSVPLVEKTLGLAPGQLQTLATQPKAKDLQFVSGTENQASGYFDKSTGKFTRLGGGGGGSGGGGGTVKSSDPKKQQAIDTILGSGKFTKDQANAVRNAINTGEDPFTVIKNQAKNTMGQTLATSLDKNEQTRDAMTQLDTALKDFYAAGGNTNILKGNFEKVANKLGEVSDPKLVDLAVQIQASLQKYRNAISGTAYSEQEGKDIASIFPGITKGQVLNSTIVKARLKTINSDIDSAYRNTLGSSYDKFKEAENTIPAQDFSKGTISGLNFSMPGVGSFTFPDQKSFDQFKKDHNLK